MEPEGFKVKGQDDKVHLNHAIYGLKQQTEQNTGCNMKRPFELRAPRGM